MKQLHVAVLMGGPSEEREVSLRSGAAVAKALKDAGARVTEVDVQGAGFELPDDTDAAFVALHGTFGEDGSVQRILEKWGAPYTGSAPEASGRAFDKILAKGRFLEARIPTPHHKVIDKYGRDYARLSRLELPVVIKPARQGSSVGVSIVRDYAALERACTEAWVYDDRLLAEEFIRGRELTVGIIDGRALPVIEIRPRQEFFTYSAKYTPNQTEYRVPAPLETLMASQAQFFALRAHQCLGCRDLSRVDMILADSGRFYVLEVNTIPGFTDTSLLPKAARAAGISFKQLCVRLVEMALARRGRNGESAPQVKPARLAQNLDFELAVHDSRGAQSI